MAIARHWTSYDWADKSLALALLGWLVLMPVATVWRWKAKPFDWANLWPTYIALMLATMLFGMRR